jgi:hypothetical protein
VFRKSFCSEIKYHPIFWLFRLKSLLYCAISDSYSSALVSLNGMYFAIGFTGFEVGVAIGDLEIVVQIVAQKVAMSIRLQPLLVVLFDPHQHARVHTHKLNIVAWGLQG